MTATPSRAVASVRSNDPVSGRTCSAARGRPVPDEHDGGGDERPGERGRPPGPRDGADADDDRGDDEHDEPRRRRASCRGRSGPVSASRLAQVAAAHERRPEGGPRTAGDAVRAPGHGPTPAAAASSPRSARPASPGTRASRPGAGRGRCRSASAACAGVSARTTAQAWAASATCASAARADAPSGPRTARTISPAGVGGVQQVGGRDEVGLALGGGARRLEVDGAVEHRARARPGRSGRARRRAGTGWRRRAAPPTSRTGWPPSSIASAIDAAREIDHSRLATRARAGRAGRRRAACPARSSDRTIRAPRRALLLQCTRRRSSPSR